MTVQLIRILNQLTTMHKELLGLSKQKTEALTKNELDSFQALLSKEKKLVIQLEEQEKERQQIVEAWSREQQLATAFPTVTEILEALNEDDQKEVENAAIQLTDTMTALKRQEQLNQGLLQESMKFVQLSMELINPTIQSMNYGTKADGRVNDRSLFDSKA